MLAHCHAVHHAHRHLFVLPGLLLRQCILGQLQGGVLRTFCRCSSLPAALLRAVWAASCCFLAARSAATHWSRSSVVATLNLRVRSGNLTCTRDVFCSAAKREGGCRVAASHAVAAANHAWKAVHAYPHAPGTWYLPLASRRACRRSQTPGCGPSGRPAGRTRTPVCLR